MKNVFIIVLFLIVLLFISSVAATIKLGNETSDIQEVYAPKEVLNGWINISLKDVSSDSLLTSSFGGSIKIIDFLDDNSASYVCVPDDCEIDYNGNNPEAVKSFSLLAGENKTIGAMVYGQIDSINKLKFYVKGSSAESCKVPLIIDILNDNADSPEYISKKTTNSFSCSVNRTGCFELDKASGSPSYIGTKSFCENIRLLVSSNYKLGAWIKKGTPNFYVGLLKMRLYKGENPVAECKLPEPTAEGSEIYCQINYSNQKEEDFFVCVLGDEETEYEIKKETNQPCGFFGHPGEFEGYTADYYIFAEAAKFASIGEFQFENDELNGYLTNYLSRYNENCSSGCLIPLTFLSGGNIQLNVSDLFLKYTTKTGATSTNMIYDAEKKSPILNSGFLVLDLKKAGFEAPEAYGNHTLIVELDSKEITNKKIKIEKIPIIKSISPTEIIAAQPTKFVVKASSPANNTLVKYSWDFGDEQTKETETNEITYTYFSIGSYKLKVSAEDDKGFIGSREFNVTVGSPEEILNISLENKRQLLENITRQVEKMSWYGAEIKRILKLNEIEGFIADMQRRYATASETEEFISIMANLTALEIPALVAEGERGDIPIYVFSDRINLENIKELSGVKGESHGKEQYVEAILNWLVDALEVNINYKEISAYYLDSIETIMVVYEVDIKKKKEIPNSFLIIEGKGLNFKRDYGQEEKGEFTGLGFMDDLTVEFFVEGIENINDLPIYISPAITEIEIIETEPCNFNGVCEKELGENNENCRQDCRRWGTLFAYIISVIFGVFVLYIILQEWYKKRYESHLFKNKDDLYNLINFIINATNQGLSENEIIDKLKKQKWRREQIIYALKKSRGKKTGMWEIPIFRFFEKRKIKKEVAKRRGAVQTTSPQPGFYKQKV